MPISYSNPLGLETTRRTAASCGHGGHTLYQYQHRVNNNNNNNGAADSSQHSRNTTSGVAEPKSTEILQERRKRRRLSSTGLFRIDSTCQCHDRDYPPWTGEIHGMSQALLSKSLPLRVFWWMVLVLCTSCGTATTVLVIIEYIRGPTATSTTIRLVPSLELPAITVCPKVPDAFNFDAVYNDMRGAIPDIGLEVARDLISFWIGGSGLENMDGLPDFNQTYLETLGRLYEEWRQGLDAKSFFHTLNAKFGYKCEDLFNNCELGGKPHNCCDTIFQPRPVMRRGLCFQTLRDINQTEADDIGRLVLEIKAPPSVTSPQFNYVQPQVIIYVNDNFEQVLDFPRFYLYPHEWNRMHFIARYIQLLEHPSDCTNKLVGKDANCFVKNWLSANVIDPFNCTVPYLDDIKDVPSNIPTCEPKVLATDYYNAIQLVHSGSVHSQECIPGCSRWEYSVSLQQSPALQPFEHHEFNLEISFYDLQYEHVKEVYTISVPGFMSQIGGQFGFFLGLSIITMLQITIYGLSALLTFFFKLPRKVVQRFLVIIKFGRSNHQSSAPTSKSPRRLAAAGLGIINPAMAETSFISLDCLEPIPEGSDPDHIEGATPSSDILIESTTTIQPAPPKPAAAAGELSQQPQSQNIKASGPSILSKRNLLSQTRKKWMSFSSIETSTSLTREDSAKTTTISKDNNNNYNRSSILEAFTAKNGRDSGIGSSDVRPRLTKQQGMTIVGSSADGFTQY